MTNHNIKISPDVLTQEVSGETVLLELKSETYFGLDRVGTRIWQLLMKKGDIQFVLEHLLDEYDVDKETLQKDLNDLLRELESSGLIEMHSLEKPKQ